MRNPEEIISDMKSATTSLSMLQFYQELKETDYSKIEASKLYNELRKKLIQSSNVSVSKSYTEIESVPIVYNRGESVLSSIIAGAENINVATITVKDDVVFL